MTSDIEYDDARASSSDTDGAESKKTKLFCQHCPKSFTLYNNLKRHVEQFHTDGIPRVSYQCHICNGKFQCEYHLSNHIRTVHEKLGRRKCKLCSKVLSNNNNLVQHMRYIHNAGSPRILFECDYCSRQFNRKTNLEYHIMYTTCNPYPIVRPTIQCQRCGRTMLRSYYKKHILKCAKINRSRNLAPRRKTQPVMKINQVCKTETGNEDQDVHVVNNKQVCNVSVKVENEHNYDLGDSTEEPSCVPCTKYEEAEMELVRRSRRKRNKVEYRVLNGESTSGSECENQVSIDKLIQKREKKNLLFIERALNEPGNCNDENKSNDWEVLPPALEEDSTGQNIKVEEHNNIDGFSFLKSKSLSTAIASSSNKCRHTNVSVGQIILFDHESQLFVKEEIVTQDHEINEGIYVKIEEI